MAHYAIVDANGKLVSDASVVDAELLARKGLVSYTVDGPPEGRPWDNAAKAWGTKPTPPPNRMARARNLFAAATTDTERIRALAVALGVGD